MTLNEDVKNALKENPTGVTMMGILKRVYPNADPWEVNGCRANIYDKLRVFERYGLVKKKVVPNPTSPGKTMGIWIWEGERYGLSMSVHDLSVHIGGYPDVVQRMSVLGRRG